MKTIFTTILITLYLLLPISYIEAQWIQTNVPNIQNITALVSLGTSIYAAGNPGGVYYSDNKGTSWTAMNTGLSNTGVWSLVVNGTNMFAGTMGGGVFLSANKGTSWNAVNTGLSNKNVVSLAIIDTILFAGTDAGVFISSNNGSNWDAVNTGLTNTNIQALVVSGTNLFAGTMGGVFLSTNKGASWSAANSGLPSGFSRGAFVSSGINIFAGIPQNGVYLSTNNGTNWSKVNTGLTNIDVFTFYIQGSNLYAGTGNGVFLSTNNGKSWSKVSSGLPASDNVLAITSIGNSLFAGNEHLGVYKLDTIITAIENVQKPTNRIQVFPNPNAGKINISFGATLVKRAFVEIYNIQGNLVFSETFNNTSTATIDLTEFSNGIYFIKAIIDGVGYEGKILKR